MDSGYDYPAPALRKAWELVCLNQFHDIIPGSSIHSVYVESQQQYAEVEALGIALRDEALRVIAARTGGDVLVVNPTAFARSDPAFWPRQLAPGQSLRRGDGAPVATQPTAGGSWLAADELPPFSVVPLVLAKDAGPAPLPVQAANDPEASAAPLIATPTLLENDCLRVEFDAAGDITRIYDKASRREVLPAGAVANQFQAFEDRPKLWDAWDIDIFYDDKLWTSEPAASLRVVEAGPLRATLEIRRRILNSAYVQRISLACHSHRLDFDTSIDWRERHIMLKVAFPVDILSPVATYEIQWGNVQRPTHRNTSWDWARFETCAHKWADLSEGDYGVSLLNDCKYGHDIHDNVLRLTLLRSPTAPDPEADQGEQRFAYSLLPHAGSWNETTIAAAYALNDPLLVAGHAAEGSPNAPNAAPQALVSVDRRNVVVETVKRAEDGNGVVVRLYESRRQRGQVTLTASFGLAAAWRTNLLEENQSELEPSGGRVTFLIRPYEIVTLRLIPARTAP
jgi:alpha-mannosidase